MHKIIDKILDQVEQQKMTATSWVLGFASVVFIRILFESISNTTRNGLPASDPYTIVHYFLSYLCIALGTSLVIGYATKKYSEAPKILLFGLPLLWLAPFVDIILSRGGGYKMLYLFDTGKQILFNFLTFFGPNLTYGVTYGMRIGLGISILGLGYYVYLKTKKIKSGLLASLFIYLIIFIFGSTPGIIYTVSHLTNTESTNQEVVTYLSKTILNSTIAHNTLREGVNSLEPARFIELGFNKLLSQIYFVISFIFGLIIFWKIDKNKFKAIFKNSRIERVNFYTFSLLCGVGFAYINNLGNKFVWVDTIGIVVLVIAWISLWMSAVHTNDIEDLKIDEISNKERPLVKKEASLEEMGDFGNIWLILGLLGAWCAGFYPFFMAIVYVAASHIYSKSPLRLRKYPLLPSFLIGTACLSTVLAGFFFISTNKHIHTFPLLLSIGIVLMVALAINFKDIKDIEGDRENEIMTLPVLFPKYGVQIVALLFALSILLIPFFLSFYALWLICVPCSIAGYKIITKKPYREKGVFTLRFILLTLIALSYIFVYLNIR